MEAHYTSNMKTSEHAKFIILTGVKHSGKSSLGTILAEKINYQFIDVDTIIEKISKQSCRELYTQKGKSGFQAVELEACQEIYTKYYKQSHNLVIATGGGICNNPNAFKLLQPYGIVLYLKVPEETACTRIIEASKKRGSYPPYIIQALKENNFLEKSYSPTILNSNKILDKDVCTVFHPHFKALTTKYEQLADITVTLKPDTKQKNAQRLLDALHI